MPQIKDGQSRRAGATRRIPLKLATVVVMLLGVIVLAPGRPALADSACDESWRPGTRMWLLNGNGGAPVWLGYDHSNVGGGTYVIGDRPESVELGRVNVCYGTGGPGEAKLIGGTIGTYEYYDYGYNRFGVYNDSDNATVAPDFSVGAGEGGWAWVDPAAGLGYVGYRIYLGACVEPCGSYAPPTYNSTYLEVELVQAPPGPGGVSAAYSLYDYCLHVDGVAVAQCGYENDRPTGATTTGTSPLNVGGPGPCVSGICLPVAGYVGTTGNQLATLWVDGTPIPIYGVHQCIYWASPTPCAW
jgi:hypothetical protein